MTVSKQFAQTTQLHYFFGTSESRSFCQFLSPESKTAQADHAETV